MPNVIVIGGGIIGCACAHELARRGAHVMVLERDELAAGASGRNHGLLLAPLDPVMVPMAAASTALYEEIQESAPLTFNLDPAPIGFLVVATDESEASAARAEAEAAAACGVRIDQLDDSGIHQLEPELRPGLAAGWLLEDARRLDPAALTVALGLIAGRHGADVGRHITARALFRDEDDRVRGVITDDGLIPADAVVVAAGPWTGSLLRPLGIDLPVTGARGWLVQVSPKRRVLRRIVNRAGWHVTGEEWGMARRSASEVSTDYPDPDVGTLLQPNLDGTMLVGGSRQPVVTAEPEDPTVPQRILRAAVRLVPALADAAVLSAWWGIRPMTPDGRPIVGELRDGLFVATGHGGQGVILGGGTAQLLASMVLGERLPFDPEPFSLGRFRKPGP
jgi:glycine/D-amino acid oxidase-like deaminating enzyme